LIVAVSKNFLATCAQPLIETYALVLLIARGPLGPLRYWFFIGFKTIKGVDEKDANGRRDSIIVHDDGSLPIFPKKCHLHNTISNPLLAHGIL
jgi:hypothetical protein